MTVRLEVLQSLDRRDFCRLTAACVAGLALFGACSEDGEAISTGPLGAEPLDAGALTGGDGGTSVGGGTCSGTPTDVGLPSVFAMNTAKLFGTFYVVRDAGGLFAVSSQCTHRAGNTVAVVSGKLRCPRHGAQFTFAGAVVSGPVTRGLVHYSICMLANGHVGVSTTQVVTTDVRLAV